MKSKKILICIPSFTFGGAENHSFLIAKTIKEIGGYTPVMFSFSKRTDAISMYENSGIEYLTYFNPILLTDNWFIKLIKWIKLIFFLRKQNIHSVISSTYYTNFNMGLAWKFSKIKHFLWHQFGVEDHIPVSYFEKLIIKTHPTYIANSEWMKENILNRHNLTDNSKTYVIKNALLKRPNKKTRDEWRKELNINSDAIVLVMTANFFPEKDFTTLLKAFQIVIKQSPQQSLKLLLAGNAAGKSSAKHESKALAFDLKLQDHVIFIDATDDVFGLYEASDIGVLSTLSEGFSNSLIEYMNSGLPIVATNIPPNIEALPEASHSFLFAPKHVEQCADKLMLFINDEILRKNSGALNKEYAIKKYSEERFFNEYKLLLESLK
jgi:glycosyltransferase involved in cell wall biosynthesis